VFDRGVHRPAGLATLVPLAVLALLAPTLMLLATRNYGLNISPDSAAYLAAAEGLARGEGVVGVDGEAMSLYAPGTSWLLTLPARWGDAEAAARLLNFAMLSALVFGVGLWLSRVVRKPVAVGAAALVAVSAPILDVHAWLWSEPPFILLSVLYVAVLVRIARSPDRVRALLITAGLLAAAATLVRYSGLSLLPIAVLVLLARVRSGRGRVLDCAIFGAAFALPVLVWLARNALLTGMVTGERVPNSASAGAILHMGVTTIGTWFVPTSVTGSSRTALMVVLAAAAVLLARAVRRRRPAATDLRLVVLGICGGHVVLTFAALVVMTSRTNVDPLGDRLLAPIVVPLVVALAAALDLALDGIPRRRAVALGAGALVLLGWGSVAAVATEVELGGEDLSSYNTPKWQNEGMRNLLARLPDGGTTTSNQPKAVNYLLGTPVRESPREHYYASTASPEGDRRRLAEMVAEGPVFLVWIGSEQAEGYHSPPQELAREFALDRLTRTAEGSIYRVSRK
jgi:hypothetical protein